MATDKATDVKLNNIMSRMGKIEDILDELMTRTDEILQSQDEITERLSDLNDSDLGYDIEVLPDFDLDDE